jgi:hypothetical protein
MGGKRFWCTLFLVLAGCRTTEPNLKPPPHPEEAVVPPESDPRFSAPIAYPKEAERDQTIKKPAKDPAGPMGSPSQFGSPGLSGRGY